MYLGPNGEDGEKASTLLDKKAPLSLLGAGLQGKKEATLLSIIAARQDEQNSSKDDKVDGLEPPIFSLEQPFSAQPANPITAVVATQFSSANQEAALGKKSTDSASKDPGGFGCFSMD
jgi:hypothetical protein